MLRRAALCVALGEPALARQVRVRVRVRVRVSWGSPPSPGRTTR